MRNNSKCTNCIIMQMTLVMAGAVTVLAQTNSLYLRAEQEVYTNSLRGEGASNSAAQEGRNSDGVNETAASRNRSGGVRAGQIKRNITPVMKSSWYSVKEPDPKHFRVHDLVTIIVEEASKHSVTAESETGRESSIDARLDDWLRLTKGALRPDPQPFGDQSIKASSTREFEGESDIKREDTLSARIQAEVIDVLPNGNLVLEASHTVVLDDETTQITLTGMCRSKDVTVDNVLLSSKIARLEVNKKHTGAARDATKRGFIHELLDFLNPF